MSNEQKTKFTQVGQVWSTKADPDKFFIKLGRQNKNNPKYDLTVELVVKDANGTVVATQTDGFLNLSDPRKSPFAKEESLAKVPNLQFDILVGTNS